MDVAFDDSLGILPSPLSIPLSILLMTGSPLFSLIRSVPMKPFFPSADDVGLGDGTDVTGDGVGYKLGATLFAEGGSEELMLGLSVVAKEGLELALIDG